MILITCLFFTLCAIEYFSSTIGLAINYNLSEPRQDLIDVNTPLHLRNIDLPPARNYLPDLPIIALRKRRNENVNSIQNNFFKEKRDFNREKRDVNRGDIVEDDDITLKILTPWWDSDILIVEHSDGKNVSVKKLLAKIIKKSDKRNDDENDSIINRNKRSVLSNATKLYVSLENENDIDYVDLRKMNRTSFDAWIDNYMRKLKSNYDCGEDSSECLFRKKRNVEHNVEKSVTNVLTKNSTLQENDINYDQGLSKMNLSAIDSWVDKYMLELKANFSEVLKENIKEFGEIIVAEFNDEWSDNFEALTRTKRGWINDFKTVVREKRELDTEQDRLEVNRTMETNEEDIAPENLTMRIDKLIGVNVNLNASEVNTYNNGTETNEDLKRTIRSSVENSQNGTMIINDRFGLDDEDIVPENLTMRIEKIIGVNVDFDINEINNFNISNKNSAEEENVTEEVPTKRTLSNLKRYRRQNGRQESTVSPDPTTEVSSPTTEEEKTTTVPTSTTATTDQEEKTTTMSPGSTTTEDPCKNCNKTDKLGITMKECDTFFKGSCNSYLLEQSNKNEGDVTNLFFNNIRYGTDNYGDVNLGKVYVRFVSDYSNCQTKVSRNSPNLFGCSDYNFYAEIDSCRDYKSLHDRGYHFSVKPKNNDCGMVANTCSGMDEPLCSSIDLMACVKLPGYARLVNGQIITDTRKSDRNFAKNKLVTFLKCANLLNKITLRN